jgi:hypothetical protein
MAKNLTASETVVVGKAIKEAALKSAASEMAAGTYAVDMTVHISGSYTVGEKYEQKFVAKAKPWNLLVVALNELNKTLAAAGEAGIEMDKLIAMAEKVDETLVEKAEADAAEAIQKVKAPTVSMANGKITTKLAVEVVEVAAAK